MIKISGSSYQQNDRWKTGSVENTIIQWMNANPTIYSYQSMDELSFELTLRKNIMESAKAMNRSNVEFSLFKNSHCNPKYWDLTSVGGFLLRHDVKPSDAIKDIYLNSSKYGFECATAMIIIYYDAVLKLLGDSLFNKTFREIYLYSWHANANLGVMPFETRDLIPGDVAYFTNPEFNPKSPQWRGENAVVFEDNTYFGHGIGIQTGEKIIRELNKMRKLGSNQSAYLSTVVTRPSFKQLYNISKAERDDSVPSLQHRVNHHDVTSIPFYQYLYW
ncbi:protein-glutamine gamma-glutamyltransferase [Sporosarcina sp. G11-34]|uniref:protein-glutamine gamma-glutamyltransferase n=1 Tax=Sporosarcina sp. G11-34 TaxID=2849605 RepID=UPI0022A98BEB|nr:protein-glutamine gamma-glutamyltransferase [Sporosarcina sp. G11-34]MCZ2258549.1 protein-glutamine gamma-glutamyltransferase [Sporosarcina sp. G11-34]